MAKKDKVSGAQVPASTGTATAPADKAVIGVRGPKGVELTAVLTLLVVANPKREGSAAFGRFAKYVDGMTVQAALDAGVTTPDLVYDAAHSHIAIAGYNPTLVVKKAKEPKEPKAPKVKKVKGVPTAEETAARGELAAATTEEKID